MLYSLGRFLQLAGLLIVPVALAGNAIDRLDLREMFTMAAIGVLVFSAGWVMQQGGKK